MNLFVRVAAPIAAAACLAAQGRDGFIGSLKDPAIARDADGCRFLQLSFDHTA
jgi:hypothetical protein